MRSQEVDLYNDTYINLLQESIYEQGKHSKHAILLVDDEEDNLATLKRTLHGSYEIITATNGKEALEIIENHKDEIAMVISDQRMPVMTGTELFSKISQTHPYIIKLLLTGYTDTETLFDAVNKCNLFQYLTKPFDPDELKIYVRNGIEAYELNEDKNFILKDLKELFYKTVQSIANALDAKDKYTAGHAQRVTLYSLMLGKELGLAQHELEEIEIAGLLHDIGKIGVPENILCKPDKLTNEEFDIIKTHPAQGKKILTNIKKLDIVSEWLNTHHERWDGRGYPLGLKGEEIPLHARIITIADSYDAMTSSRAYRTALSHETAIDQIEKNLGSQFDPNLAAIFIKIEASIRDAKDNFKEYMEKYSILNTKIY